MFEGETGPRLLNNRYGAGRGANPDEQHLRRAFIAAGKAALQVAGIIWCGCRAGLKVSMTKAAVSPVRKVPTYSGP